VLDGILYTHISGNDLCNTVSTDMTLFQASFDNAEDVSMGLKHVYRKIYHGSREKRLRWCLVYVLSDY
jgi:hypothetical protein